MAPRSKIWFYLKARLGPLYRALGLGSTRRARRRTPFRLPVITTVFARVRLGLGVQPLSVISGADRGLSIHRFYLEQFMQEFKGDIRGQCLEFQNDQYTSRFGGARVSHLDILHKEGSGKSKHATIIADLLEPNDVPSSAFDTIICTHVLHIVEDPPRLVRELYRLLKTGGVVLLAVPHVAGIQPWWHELWRYTPEGLQRLAAGTFGAENVTLRYYGNTLAAAGAMRGLVAAEFTRRELSFHDERFAVEVAVRAVKR